MAGVLGLLALALIPIASRTTVVAPGLVPIAAALILVADGVGAAVLLRSDGGRNPRRPWLAACFAFSGLMALVFLGTYPRLMALHGVLGGPPEAFAWTRLAWQGGPLLCLVVVLGLPDRFLPARRRTLPGRDGSSGDAFPWVLMTSTGLALVSLLGAELAAASGPPPLRGTSYAGLWQVVAGLLLGLILVLAVPALRRLGQAPQPERSLTAIALVGSASMLLTIVAARRYSLGWDAAWVLWAATAGLMALVCVGEAISRNRVDPTDRLRPSITDALSRLDPTSSVESLATALCTELKHRAGLDYAALIRSGRSGLGVVVGACPEPEPHELGFRDSMAPQTWQRLMGRCARDGGFVEVLPSARASSPGPGGYPAQLRPAGLRAMAHAPVVMGGRVEWVLTAGRGAASDGAAVADLTQMLPTLADVAAMASVLLATGTRTLRTSERVCDQVQGILREGSFHPVFQPIVAVDSGLVIGHEALTRFENGVPPDQIFTSAASAGMGTQLELACLAASIGEARQLPGSTGWLSLNVSPALLLTEGDALNALLATADRAVVLEVTEHELIDNYSRLREALAELTTDLKVAVDDAGAGFASLRHVVELRPAYVKLDISLVRDLDQDPMRQAMVTGLVAFARHSGCALIAEGVETVSELATLRALGVGYVQGFLLGRPVRAGLAVTSGAARPSIVPAATVPSSLQGPR